MDNKRNKKQGLDLDARITKKLFKITSKRGLSNRLKDEPIVQYKESDINPLREETSLYRSSDI